MAARRRPRLLALLAFAAVLLLAQQAACATLNTEQSASDADSKATGGKKANKEAAAAPAPQPARKKPAAKAAAKAPAAAPAAQDSSPSPSPSPLPSPSPEAAASPPPAPAYCPPGSGCVLYRLIMKVEGGPNPLSQLDASNILAAVNSLAAPVVFEYRTQQPSAPGQLPAVDGATVKDPPVKKVSGKAGKAAAGDGAGTEPAAAAGSDATAADTEAAAAAAAADPFAAESMGAAGQTAQRRLLRARRLGQGAAAAAAGAVAAPTSRGLLQEAETANSCPKPKYQFEVQTAAECEEKCNLKVAGGKTATVSPSTSPSPSGGQLCCDCKYKKDTVPAPTKPTATAADAQPSATQPAEASGTGWWPAVAITQPLTVDGVYVFVDAQVLSYGVDPLAIKLLEASNTGQLCSTINEYGVNCDGTAIMFQGTGDIVFVRNTQTTPSSSGSGGGLTTAAIVGIVVGGVVALCAVAVLVHMVASCRRERVIERATRQRMEKRTASRKAAIDAAEAAAAENSRWRQTYSDRMAESMRRADEALGRQSSQAHGPSFVEAQERELARQAGGQLSSKMSFGRSSSIKGSPKSEDLERSIDGSLMAGSELSSPQPSVTSSAKGGRSLKNLFGGKK